MSPLLDFYRAYGRLSLTVELQYRASLVIWQIATVLEPMVLLVVWSTAARGGGGRIAGYGPPDFAAYYLALLLVNRLTSTYVQWIFEARVRQGQFSAALLRPIHPIHADVAEQLTHNLLAFVTLLPALEALWFFFRPALHPAPATVLAFLLALVGAFVVRFLLEWSFTLAAFWTTRTTAVDQLYFTTYLFFSGTLAPLALFPEWVRAAAAPLPFRPMIGSPVELLLGQLAPTAVLTGFLAQLAWAALGLALLALFWRAGIRRYTVVGA